MYSLSSLQADITAPLSQEILDWGISNVAEDHLYLENFSMFWGVCPETKIFGRSINPHITILYGIVASHCTVQNVFKQEKEFSVTLQDITTFQNERYDVLKIDVVGSKLDRLHKIANNDINNISQYPTFKPHITIAYLKKGTLLNIDKNKFNGINVTISELSLNTSLDSYSIPLKQTSLV